MNLPVKHIYFQNLDGLRFLSFLYVFFAHSFPTTNPLIRQTLWYQVFKGKIFFDGEPGVSFFFVLSGFLITYLLMQEREVTSTINVKSFYIRRILRIWPLYYFCVFFGFVIFPRLKELFGGLPNETANPFLSSFFLNNFDRIINGPPDSSVLAVLWSVAIEEQFYLLWPLLFFLIPTKYYSFIFIFIIEASLVYRITHIYGSIDINSLGVITDMALGGLGAFLSLRNKQFSKLIRESPPFINLIPYVAVLICIIFKDSLFFSPIMLVHKRIVFGFLFTWIILEQNLGEKSFFKIGNNKLLTRLGKYTYGLYCLHSIALLITITLLNKLNLRDQSWEMWIIEFPLAMFLSIYFSVISYNYFESYFLKVKKKFMYVQNAM